jgi:hypothetical protein
MYVLYFTLVRSKPEYASLAWNSITSTDANKLERVQQKFAALCYNSFFLQVYYSHYSTVYEQLKLHTLRMRRHHLEELFFIQVYLCSKFCPSVLGTVTLRVPARYIRGFALFSVCSLVKAVPLLHAFYLLILLEGS